MRREFCVEIQKERDISVNDKIISKLILGKYGLGAWPGFMTLDRDRC